MTIHKSKGLEFGAVVLPRLDRKVHSIYSKLLCGKEFAIALDSTRDRFVEQKPSYFLAAERLNKIMDEEEKKRLLYVALTRARDYLCLLLPVGAPKQASLGTWLRSVLDIQIDEGECELTNGSESARFSVHIAELTDEETINEMLADATESIEQEAAAGDDDENLIALQLDVAFLDALADEDEETRPVHISVLPEGSDQFSGLTDVLLERVSQASDHVARRSNLPGRVTAPAGGWKPDPASVGTFFHAIMSRVSSSNHQLPDNRLLSSLLYSELAIVLPEQEDEMIAEAKRLFEIFQRSPLSSMIKSARRHLHELPYWVMRASEPEGRPDLVIEDEEGQWHIIDYKTDHLTKKDLEKQIRTHAAQLTGYVEDFRLITNLDARPWLYFAQLGLLEPVDTRKTVQLALPF